MRKSHPGTWPRPQAYNATHTEKERETLIKYYVQVTEYVHIVVGISLLIIAIDSIRIHM